MIYRAIGGRWNRFGLDGMWMYVECVCGYEQVGYSNVEGDWGVGDVCIIDVLYCDRTNRSWAVIFI